MAGRPALRGHSDPFDNLGISRGHIIPNYISYVYLLQSLLWFSFHSHTFDEPSKWYLSVQVPHVFATALRFSILYVRMSTSECLHYYPDDQFSPC